MFGQNYFLSWTWTQVDIRQEWFACFLELLGSFYFLRFFRKGRTHNISSRPIGPNPTQPLHTFLLEFIQIKPPSRKQLLLGLPLLFLPSPTLLLLLDMPPERLLSPPLSFLPPLLLLGLLCLFSGLLLQNPLFLKLCFSKSLLLF